MKELNKVLIEAVEENKIKKVKACVKKGATNLNEALKWASLYGYKDIVKYLVEKGADCYEESLALIKDQKSIYKTIEYFGSEKISKKVAPKENYEEITKLLETCRKIKEQNISEERE